MKTGEGEGYVVGKSSSSQIPERHLMHQIILLLNPDLHELNYDPRGEQALHSQDNSVLLSPASRVTTLYIVAPMAARFSLDTK